MYFRVSGRGNAAYYASVITHLVFYKLYLFIWHCFQVVLCSSKLGPFSGGSGGVWQGFRSG